MKDRKFVFASVLIGIFLLTVGLTYAYFSLTVSGNDVAETINVDTIKLELKYTDGKVALIYPSDYMYASSACYNDESVKGSSSDSSEDYSSDTCLSTNWLFIGSWYWALSPNSSNAVQVMGVNGSLNSNYAGSAGGGLCQSVYLDSGVKYISGDGSKEKAFEIE